MAKNWIKSHARNFSKKIHKVHKSIEKRKHLFFFINFKHVKMSQNNQKYIKKHIAIFLGIFVRKLERTGVQVARTEACIAKISRKIKRNPKTIVMKPKPTQLGGSGSPERLRGVGLIRIP